ncbi:MAG: hypothetical protein OEZ39_09310 [Gammaproteobacteria bacterium]|nr:hypothetical protein [Gammaproteobacteria bacterium]MDH5652042.1 hypothetical protein [Gammaproteobacteria bacterium]
MRLIFLLLLLVVYPAHAKTITYNCNYSTVSSPKGLEKVKGKFTLKFTVDTVTGKAFVVGNQGLEEVIPQINQMRGGITFIEITSSRNVMTTAIDGAGNSVHSRATILDIIVPSQYYGSCNAEN